MSEARISIIRTTKVTHIKKLKVTGNLPAGQLPQIPQVKGPLKPEISCGNLEPQPYAFPNFDIYGNKATDIYNLDSTTLKGHNSHRLPVRQQNFGTYADVLTINHRGYIFAPQDGKYTPDLPSSDDITLFRVHQKAYSGQNRQNADIIQQFVSSGGSHIQFQIDIQKDNSILFYEDSEDNDYIVRFSYDNTDAPKLPNWGFET
ncbi:hypothetical protein AA313_de0210368 [Arthrobotrys entomopaga]|nr:hypothetical protein AA313_de0210368 [Arthrobotrys entomopaga]